MHAPATVDELELAVVHERTCLVLLVLGLLVPPSLRTKAESAQRNAAQRSPGARVSRRCCERSRQATVRARTDREETDFDVDELAVGVLQKPRDDRVQDVVDVAEEILVDGDLPARHAAPLVTPS